MMFDTPSTHTVQLLLLNIPFYLAINNYISWHSTCRIADLLYRCAATCYCFPVGDCQARTPCEWVWIHIILTVAHVVEWKSLQTSPSVLDCSIWSPYHSIQYDLNHMYICTASILYCTVLVSHQEDAPGTGPTCFRTRGGACAWWHPLWVTMDRVWFVDWGGSDISHDIVCQCEGPF